MTATVNPGEYLSEANPPVENATGSRQRRKNRDPGQDPSSRRLLTVEEARKILRVSDKTMLRKMAAKEIQGYREGGRWRIPAEELEAYIRRRLVEPRG